MNSNGKLPIRDDVTVGKASTSTERSKMSEPIIPLPATLSEPTEGVKLGHELPHQNQTLKVENIRGFRHMEETNVGETKMQSRFPVNSLSKPSINQEKMQKAGELNQAQPQRPSNPFFKSSIK